MGFSATLTHDSKAFSGVRFTVRRMGYARRVSLDFDTLALRQRQREIEMENPPSTPHERELNDQILIARKKALAVPESEMDQVIREDLTPLLEALASAADVETKKRRAVLQEEYATVESKVREAWIRAALVSISGGDFDDMTVAEFLDSAPPQLAAEVWEALSADGRVIGEDAKNSPSPGTSGAVVPLATNSTTALDAAPVVGTPTGTV